MIGTDDSSGYSIKSDSKGELIFMKDMKKFVLGGLTVLGVASAAYRAFELRKMKKAMEEQVIEVTPEKVEEVETTRN